MNTTTRIRKSTAAVVIALVATVASTSCATQRGTGDLSGAADSARVAELRQGYRELAQARVESAREHIESARADAARQAAAYHELAEARAASASALADQRSSGYADLAERRARLAGTDDHE